MRHLGAQIEEVSLVVSLETLVPHDQNFPDQNPITVRPGQVLADLLADLELIEKPKDLAMILIRLCLLKKPVQWSKLKKLKLDIN